MKETSITPMLRNYLKDEVSCKAGDADWFRVVVNGVFVKDVPVVNGLFGEAFRKAHQVMNDAKST